MLGICPHCKIELNKPPFNKRNTNEVMLTLNYRKMVEGGEKLKDFIEAGFCELCKAKVKDKKEQQEKG